MKFPLPALFVIVSTFLAGCNSLENPLGGLLDTGRDARVYNPQTGEFEWPKDAKRRSPGRPSPATARSAPAEERRGDGRYFDAQKNEWVEAPVERPPAPKSKGKPTPAPVLMVTPPPVGTPPPERPPRARGIYNPSTGQIEWTDFDPPPAATPAPRKSKWWPF